MYLTLKKVSYLTISEMDLDSCLSGAWTHGHRRGCSALTERAQ